jgi:hypothetical protein
MHTAAAIVHSRLHNRRGFGGRFEDVIMYDRVDHYTPSFDKEHVNARVYIA